ncbi:hypothetical protein NADFUDRAFT_52152 [Nadsonia fulvescens var. elongata DSM 6958]|uniref:C2 domain-containing protein n=1 Tax=Nadsonia fulvescens var. elongata DSM 6958 TaxID=857566 RepID=A0A1E3PGI3_9ASCO|nr:hypothetical protein NADFUDRAFT_52152 [Nadsonia fulvescens var. elongata DSM 6958]
MNSTKQNVAGTLVVIFMKAKNLPNRRTLGKQNPYCIGRIGFDAKRCPAEERGGQSPKWDHEVRYTIIDKSPASSSSNLSLVNRSTPSPPPATTFKLTVLDENEGKPELIGDCVVDLTEALLSHPDEGWDRWHELKYKGKYAGEVYIEMTFYSTQPLLPKKVKKKIKAVINPAQVPNQAPVLAPFQNQPPISQLQASQTGPMTYSQPQYHPSLSYRPLPTPIPDAIDALPSSKSMPHLSMPELSMPELPIPIQEIPTMSQNYQPVEPSLNQNYHPHRHGLPNPADYQVLENNNDSNRGYNHGHSYGHSYNQGHNPEPNAFSRSHPRPQSHSRSLGHGHSRSHNYGPNYSNNHSRSLNSHHSPTRSLNSHSMGYPNLDSLSLQDLDLPSIPPTSSVDVEKPLPEIVPSTDDTSNHTIRRKPVGSTPTHEFGTTQKINKVLSNIQRRQVEPKSNPSTQSIQSSLSLPTSFNMVKRDDFMPFSADDYDTFKNPTSLMVSPTMGGHPGSEMMLTSSTIPNLTKASGKQLSDDVLDVSTYAPEPVRGKGRSLPQTPADLIPTNSGGVPSATAYLGQGQWDLSDQLNARYSDSIYDTVTGQKQKNLILQHSQLPYSLPQSSVSSGRGVGLKPPVPPKIPMGMTAQEYIAAEYGGRVDVDDMRYYNYI